jgi:hypothetical protein
MLFSTSTLRGNEMFHPNQHPFVSGFATEQLNHEAELRDIAAKRDRTARFIRFGIYLAITVMFGIMFSIFAWTGVNITPPTDREGTSIPAWLWHGTFFIVSVGCLISAAFAVMKAFDELIPTSRIISRRP